MVELPEEEEEEMVDSLSLPPPGGERPLVVAAGLHPFALPLPFPLVLLNEPSNRLAWAFKCREELVVRC